MALTQLDYSQLSSTTFVGLGRNRVINGEMSIDQVRGGASFTVNATASTGILDMYTTRGTSAEGVYTSQRITTTPPTGFAFLHRVTTTTASATPAAGSRYEFQNRIEGITLRDFLFGTSDAKTFTLSFWVRSSLTGTFSVAFQNDAQNRSYIANYTINSANTWEQKVITLAGDTTGTWVTDSSASGLIIIWDIGSGSTAASTAGSWQAGFLTHTTGSTRVISTNAATLDITGVQVELGSAATAFEYRPFLIEVQLCQRYYEKSYALDTAIGTNTTTNTYSSVYAQTAATTMKGQSIAYKVLKRVAPTVTLYQDNASNTTGSWRFVNTTGTTTARTVTVDNTWTHSFNAAQTTAVEYYSVGQWVSDARI